MTQAIQNGHASLDALGQDAGSIAPPTEADRIAAAEANKDTDTTMAMKSAQLGRLLK